MTAEGTIKPPILDENSRTFIHPLFTSLHLEKNITHQLIY